MSTKTKIACSADLFRRVLLSWLTAAVVEELLLPSTLRSLERTSALEAMSAPRLAAVGLAVFTALTLLARRWDTRAAERFGLVGVFAVLSALSLAASFSWAVLLGCFGIAAALVVCALRGWDPGPPPAPGGSGGGWGWAVAAGAAAFFLFVSAWGVGRVLSFSTPTYDFGIFAQMFHYMKSTGLPLTTLERDGLLSHFAVHVSPIYYLMLPFYALVPTPATLQVLQAAVLASAVAPLWKLGRHHGLGGGQRALLCGVLLLYPAFAGGTGYDLHENCFLTPLILWLLLGLDRKHVPTTALAAGLTLLVKEDAAVYAAVAGLWSLARGLLRRDRWDVRAGAAVLAASLGWFGLVTGYLARYGEGVMTYRYGNFLYGGSEGLATVVLAALLRPMKVVWECLEPEKLPFLARTLGPLLGLPLLTRRYERYLLLIPYVLVNLMSDYRYQHDLFFQYTFGSTAFLLYLTAADLADLRPARRWAALAGAALVSAVCFCQVVVPKAAHYPAQAVRQQERYAALRQALDAIPADAAVTASTFYTTALSQRDILYDLRYGSAAHLLETTYIVFDPNAEKDLEPYGGLEGFQAFLTANGYAPWGGVEGMCAIWEKQTRQPGCKNAGPSREVRHSAIFSL